MKLSSISITYFKSPLITGLVRIGFYLNLIDEKGNQAMGEVSPLPGFSEETLEDAFNEYHLQKQTLLNTTWTIDNIYSKIPQYIKCPSLRFGFESALLSLLDPLPKFDIPISGFLIGDEKLILEQADDQEKLGYLTAKLKVGNLSLDVAGRLIHRIKDRFRLRIDVNQAWNDQDSLNFFSQFPSDSFDYVEEPLKDKNLLSIFPHPIAVDEAFREQSDFHFWEKLPNLKAVIYKPMIQGGILPCRLLRDMTTRRGKQLILSSSYETDVGLNHIAGMAYRLGLNEPLGIGTRHCLMGQLATCSF